MKFENRFLNNMWQDDNFFRLLPKALLTSPFYPLFENFWLIRLIKARQKIENRRTWLLSLGVSWLAALVPLVALAVLMHFSSYANFWTWLWSGVRLQEPPAWIFLLGDARLNGLLFCALLGFLPAFLTGWGFWTWMFVPIALFPGVLSLPGGWVMVFSERLAIWIRASFVSRDASFRKDILMRGTLAIVIWIALLIMAPITREWIQFFVGSSGFDPEIRFLQWSLGLAFWAAMETILALAVLHFYHPLTSEREEPEIWDFRLGRWPSPWDQEVMRQLWARGEQVLSSLQANLQQMDPETQKRIPRPVLDRMHQQLNELESLRQKSVRHHTKGSEGTNSARQ